MPSSVKIQGNNPLIGELQVAGAKNSVTKLMVASLLSNEKSFIKNVPNIKDVSVVSEMITLLGGVVEHDEKKSTISIDSSQLHSANSDLLRSIDKKSRIPILFAGPLLARIGEAFVPELGGCEIGPRPVNFHILALEKMGAAVEYVENGFHLKASRLHGARITLPYPSVGTTEQVLFSAVLAEGTTELSNAAIEPEIIDLVCALQKMGADISLTGDRTIIVRGVSNLVGFSHSVIPDRLEAASWACAAAATNGEIFIKGATQIELMSFLNKFRQAGGSFTIQSDGIVFGRGSKLHSITLETNVYPGFATDWQQPLVTLLTQANGVSVVHETVYEDRFKYTSSLNEMGARIQLHTECLGGLTCRFGRLNHFHSATIHGPTQLKGKELIVPDLRAGFAYIIAAVSADGESIIKNVDLLERGYDGFLNKLRSVKANISITA